MSKAQLEERKSSGEKIRGGEVSEMDLKMSETLAKVADEVGNGATVTSIAIAWALLKHPYVFPISEHPPKLLLTRSRRSKDQSPRRQHQGHHPLAHTEAGRRFGVGLPLPTPLSHVGLWQGPPRDWQDGKLPRQSSGCNAVGRVPQGASLSKVEICKCVHVEGHRRKYGQNHMATL